MHSRELTKIASDTDFHLLYIFLQNSIESEITDEILTLIIVERRYR